MPNSPLNSNPQTAPGGRSLGLILATLIIFAAVWWFWPFPSSARPAVVAPAKSVAEVQTKLPSQQVVAPSATNTTSAQPQYAPNAPTVARKLGPSKGSLLPNPKPRDMVVAADLSKALDVLNRLDPNDRLLTALTIEEAEWMDAVGFPTIEEINSIDPEDMQKNIGVKNPNIRGLAIQAAIWLRQGDPRWEVPAGLLVAWGCPFGTRLYIQWLMQQPANPRRDKSLIFMTMLGNLVGDPYKPYQIRLDHRKQWTNWDAMNADEVLYAFQVQIPASRARIGLPPLQMTLLPREYWVVRP